jgi:Acyl-CoA reductase (LuxC)
MQAIDTATASTANAETMIAKAVIRGQIIDTNLKQFGGRGEGDISFLSPDPHAILPQLPLSSPGKLADLYDISFGDILDYLVELGTRLDPKTNPHLQRALQGSYLTAPTTRPIVDYFYHSLHRLFRRDVITEVAEKTVGIDYLEGWVSTPLADGRSARIRAFGSRALHIVAGNAPWISGMTIVRNAVTRSDAIIKAPSNDPFTAAAIALTMCEMAPDHPLTRHISVAYWKGGDEAFERELYQPHHIEKIIAWGGFASVKHVTRYVQPGLELISLDPKNSISVIGKEVFASEAAMREAARKLAIDFGTGNQAGCVNSRRAYVESGTDEAGLQQLKTLGAYTYEALMGLPPHISTKPKHVNRDLKAHIESIRPLDDWYHVIGGLDDEGAVIVSLMPEAVNFAMELDNRTLNMIPVDSMDDVLKACDAYTQTVGIWPEELKARLRNRLPLHGVQRIVSLGFAATTSSALPQDAIEPMRRACKWIVDEVSVPEVVSPIWVE